MLIWLDLETTGFEPHRHQILEVAVCLAARAAPFEPIASYHAILRPEPEVFAPHILELHASLLKECARSDLSVGAVEASLLELVPQGTREDPTMLAGCSVHFDRGFLEVHMPRLAARLYHRHYDVSSVFEFCQDLGMPYEKRDGGHRAPADVRAAMELGRMCATWVASSNNRPVTVAFQTPKS